MDSSATIRPTDPRDLSPGLSTQDAELVARADQRLAHAYEQIALADEQLARVNKQISGLENEGARKNRSRRPSRGRPALRGLIGLLLTAGICTAAFAWHSYGETARPMIAQWSPKLAAASSLPSETWKLAADTPSRVVQIAPADPAIWQSPAPAQSVAQDAVSPVSPETAQLLQTVARDLASVRQEIEQLRASQEALSHETARNAEQLKESQEQTARAIAAVSERNLRRASVATPLPVASPARRPVATLVPTEARAQARPPVRLQPRQQ
jgi:hypothetical protein